MNQSEQPKTGTTTVGILANDAVILAADRRATAGNLIVSKTTQKVAKVADNVALTTAGSVSEIQLIAKLLRARIRLKNLEASRNITGKEAANLLSTINYSNVRRSMYPAIAHFVLAAYDYEGPHLYDVFPDGSLSEITAETGFIASGSGSTFAFGLLEDAWEPDLSVEDAAKLAKRAIKAALRRDSASGNGLDVFVINEDGVTHHETQKLTEVLE